MLAAPAHSSFGWLFLLLVPLALASAALALRARRRRRPPPLPRALIAGALERPRRWPRR